MQRVDVETTPENSGASELACRITNRVLALDGLQPTLQACNESFDAAAFAGAIARQVDSEIIADEQENLGPSARSMQAVRKLREDKEADKKLANAIASEKFQSDKGGE